MPTEPFLLYGAPVSLYTGKARSYLRKQGIRFVDVSPGSDRYLKHIVPNVGRWIIPVLETPSGHLIQDGADIIRYFEEGEGRGLGQYPPAIPQTPLHQAVSNVFEFFGGEGLLRPAMHYRWNFDDQNLAFLQSEFALLTPEMPAESKDKIFAHNSGRMRKAAVSFGVTPESAPLIEENFHEWLDLFSAHLAESPYLLGGYPTLGDYGLMAAMWAHLFRDPAPTALIKRHAPRVGRWVERMSTSDPNQSEYARPHDEPAQLFANDEIPETLNAMMRYVAQEYLPEVTAFVNFTNDWLVQRPEIEPGTNGLEKPGDRGIGVVEFEWRGITLRAGVMPYRLWLMQHIPDGLALAPDADQSRVRSVFAATGLEPLLDLRTIRRVERVNYLEVWGPLTTA